MIPLIQGNWLVDRNLAITMNNSMPPRDPEDDDDEDEDEDDEADEPAVIREPDPDE